LPDRHSGHFDSEFEYARTWIDTARAFARDPVSLPLDPNRRFRAEMLYPPLSVFDDALPDDWGRRLLAAASSADGIKPTLPEMLLRMRGGGTGALLFTATESEPLPAQSIQSSDLQVVLAAAARYEAGTLAPGTEFSHLLDGSSRAGGARPKALLHDESGEWLAKFPSRVRDDGYDVVGLEATCLKLAPLHDVTALYRQMAFNAAIGNVDDHLKNFWMIVRPGGYRLAPAFDSVPDISGRGELPFHFIMDTAARPERNQSPGTEWGVAEPVRIIDTVTEAAAVFGDAAHRLKVRYPDTLRMACADVRRYVGLLGEWTSPVSVDSL
jgi:hypothetical protein